MRFRPASRAAIVGASLVLGGTSSGHQAQADILIGSTLIPTSSVVSTSAYVPTSTVLPTSYVVPTSTYLSTGSVIETGSYSYTPTSYVETYRRGLFGPRRFVERTNYYASPTSFLTPTVYTPTSYLASSAYIPTAYVTSSAYIPTSYVVPTLSTSALLPTTYFSRSGLVPTAYVADNGLIATTALASSSVCCDTGVATTVAPVETTATRAQLSRPTNPAPSSGGSAITSKPQTGVTPQPSERAPSASIAPTPADEARPVEPIPPPVEPTSPPSPDRPADGPAMPLPGQISKPPTDERVNSTSFKPSTYNTARPIARNILRGRVISFDTLQPEEAVTVVLTSRTGGYADRPTLTDADGEFKVSLPDGDWAVKVTMPSGSVFNVGRALTASGGRVSDPNGKNVGEMIIKR